MKILAFVSTIALAAVVTAGPVHAQKKGAPCSPAVPGFRGYALKMVYKISIGYEVNDEGSARQHLSELLNAALNQLGKDDQNTFVIADGVTPNFTVHGEVSNDGTDHYMLSGQLGGWGQGTIGTIFSGENRFSTERGLVDGFAKSIYGWIHNGWRDSRPGC